jgi:DNA mismatch endonuclease (patch repair protein)
VDFAELPGRPDIVVLRARIAIFCDGDFWHGRDLARRLAKLERGHNPRYWVEKIKSNYDRDRRNEGSLRSAGWLVLRFWETDVLEDPFKAAEAVANAIRGRTRTALPE